MSDYLADTPSEARVYCPGCEPDADPQREILDLRYCEPHVPVRTGPDDDRAGAITYVNNNEAGGDDNRLWNDLLMRGIRRT